MLIPVISIAIYLALTVAIFALLGAVQNWVETL
ncbi:potassium-transporting ATPase [Mycolicibacterium sp.]